MRWAIAFLVLAILFTMGVSAYAGGGRIPVDPFTLWAVSPYAAFLVLCLGLRQRGFASGISAVGAVLAAAFGILSFTNGFFIHLSSCSPLLFIWVPLYQWGGWLLFALLAAVASAAQPRSLPPR